jgi:segregation and condensation protein B
VTRQVARTEAHRALEAIVLVAEEPVTPNLLAQLLERPVVEIEAICEELAAEYESMGAGFALVRVAGGYRFQTVPEAAPYVERFVLEGQSARLSAAALETLAIVAYKQPLSRAQVAAIRGVNVDGVMRTLQQRGYIEEVARDAGPGQALLYGTTRSFLEKLGIDSLDDLPPLGEFVPGPEVMEALEAGLRISADEVPTPAAGSGSPVDQDVEDDPREDDRDQGVPDHGEQTGGVTEGSAGVPEHGEPDDHAPAPDRG